MKLTIEQAIKKGILAHKEGKLKEAEGFYRAVLRSQPTHPDANHNLGVLAASVNKTDLSLPLFKAALDANPKIEQFWLSYINALITEKQFANAKQFLDKGKKNGILLKKLNTLEEKIIQGIKVNYNDGTPSQKKLNKLLEYYQNKQYDHAEKLALSLTQEFPNHEFGWRFLGVLYGQTGRLYDSVDANKKAAQLEPKNAEVQNNLGVTLQKLGKLEDAEVSYRKAISLNPNYFLGNNTQLQR